MRTAQAAGLTSAMKAMFGNNFPIFGILNIKQMKLSIKKFDAIEPYKGLGTNFGEWDLKFMCQITIAQITPVSVGKTYKINSLSTHLDDKATCYFETQSPIWMRE